MDILSQALGQIKDDLQQFLNKKWIEQTCHDIGYTWRDRTLDPLTTIQLFTHRHFPYDFARQHRRTLRVPV